MSALSRLARATQGFRPSNIGTGTGAAVEKDSPEAFNSDDLHTQSIGEEAITTAVENVEQIEISGD